MKIKKTIFAATLGTALFTASSAYAALELRLDGQAVYDTDLNITWLQNPRFAALETFGVSGIDSYGRMSWDTSQNWIAAMNAAKYLGFSDWRLPTVVDVGTPGLSGSFYDGTGDVGYNVTSSEMGHLYYSELGNLGLYSVSGLNPQPGWGLKNTGPFSNFTSNGYWSGMEYALDTNKVWYFSAGYGYQGAHLKSGNMPAWAVRSGDSLSPVPEPEAYVMLLAGLGLLGFTAKRRKLGT